jgi:hypothetical protein
MMLFRVEVMAMTVSGLRSAPPGGLIGATTAGLLARGDRGEKDTPVKLALFFPSLKLSELPLGGRRTSVSPLTVAGAATDLPPEQTSSRGARCSLFTRSRGTVDA